MRARKGSCLACTASGSAVIRFVNVNATRAIVGKFHHVWPMTHMLATNASTSWIEGDSVLVHE